MSPTSKDQRLRILEEKLKTKEEKIIEIRGKLKVETDEKQIRKMNIRLAIEEKSRKLIADEIERMKGSTIEYHRDTTEKRQGQDKRFSDGWVGGWVVSK